MTDKLVEILRALAEGERGPRVHQLIDQLIAGGQETEGEQQ